MGIYYSLYEWYNPLGYDKTAKYVAEHMTPQFKDLVTRYKPSIIFSDGEWDMPGEDWQSPSLLAWLFNESPVEERCGRRTIAGEKAHGISTAAIGRRSTPPAWTAEATRGKRAGAWASRYGYNRAETVKDYRTERELILMLVDLVSRGGNLLLDIGPDSRWPHTGTDGGAIIADRPVAEDQWRSDLRNEAMKDNAAVERRHTAKTGDRRVHDSL